MNKRRFAPSERSSHLVDVGQDPDEERRKRKTSFKVALNIRSKVELCPETRLAECLT